MVPVSSMCRLFSRMFGLRLQKLVTRTGRQAPYRLEFQPSPRRHRISTPFVISWLGTPLALLARVCDLSWQHERSAILGRKFPSWVSMRCTPRSESRRSHARRYTCLRNGAAHSGRAPGRTASDSTPIPFPTIIYGTSSARARKSFTANIQAKYSPCR